jgi:regulator of replication initiation timing
MDALRVAVRRIAALERELAERNRQNEKMELENVRLRKVVENFEGANRSVAAPMQATGGRGSKLHVQQQE